MDFVLLAGEEMDFCIVGRGKDGFCIVGRGETLVELFGGEEKWLKFGQGRKVT